MSLVQIAKLWWWLVLAAAIVGGLLGYAYASRVTPTYQAEARLLVGPITAQRPTLQVAGELTRSYAELATSQAVLDAAAETVDAANRSAQPGVRANAQRSTRLLTIRVRASNADSATEYAGAIADELVRLSTSSSRQPQGRLQVIDPATSAAKIGPQMPLSVQLGALAGLFASVGVVLLLESRRRVVRSVHELADVAPPESFIVALEASDLARLNKRSQENGGHSSSFDAGEYQRLAARVASAHGGTPRSILVVGAAGHEAVGRTALNLASSLVESGSRITLIDADTEKCEVTRILGLRESSGFRDVLARGTMPAPGRSLDNLASIRKRLHVLPCGQNAALPTTTPQSLRQMLAQFLDDTDTVVVTAPAVGRSASTLHWAHVAQSTLLLVRQTTSRDAVTGAIHSLLRAGANVVGIALVRRRLRPF